MKKKFLSLMMAAAVVATTSVSAFAQEGGAQDTTPAENNVHVTMPDEANVTDTDDQAPTQDVKITGHVQNDKGEMPTTTFKVTVPTAANFTVTNKGNLVGPELTIKNEGTQGVDVYAYNFLNTGKGGIRVVGEDTVTAGDGANVERSTVSLKLLVNEEPKAYLGAELESCKQGVYNDKTLASGSLQADGIKLLSLEAGADKAKEKTIKIAGTAGKKTTLAKPVSDTFKLVLKIKKTPVTQAAAR